MRLIFQVTIIPIPTCTPLDLSFAVVHFSACLTVEANQALLFPRTRGRNRFPLDHFVIHSGEIFHQSRSNDLVVLYCCVNHCTSRRIEAPFSVIMKPQIDIIIKCLSL